MFHSCFSQQFFWVLSLGLYHMSQASIDGQAERGFRVPIRTNYLPVEAVITFRFHARTVEKSSTLHLLVAISHLDQKQVRGRRRLRPTSCGKPNVYSSPPKPQINTENAGSIYDQRKPEMHNLDMRQP